MRVSQISALFFGIALISACDCGGGEPGIHGLHPKLEVSPSGLDFGTLAVGNERLLDLTVRNSGEVRLDIGERLKAAKDKLSTDLSFAEGKGCLKAQTHKIEVTGVHVHAAYLRIYVDATASAP